MRDFSDDSALLDFLLVENILSKSKAAKNQLRNYPEYKILQQIYSHEKISFVEIDNKLNLGEILKTSLSKLESKNLVHKNENDEWQLTSFAIKGIRDSVTSKKGPNQDDRRIVSASSRSLSKAKEKATSKIPKQSKSKPKRSKTDKLQTNTLGSNDSSIDEKGRPTSFGMGRHHIAAQAHEPQKANKSASDIDDLFNEALDGETMVDFLSDFEELIVTEDKGGQQVVTGPIIEILKAQGYIKGDLSTEEQLQEVPEYKVLMIIIKDHPISLNEIEEKAKMEIVSMVLSNLQADQLIDQTNDYRWTISAKVRENLLEFISQIKGDEPLVDNIATLRLRINKKAKYERQFIYAMFKLGIVDSLELSLMEMMEIPDFVVIKTIKDDEPIEIGSIQRMIELSNLDIPPVQVTRMLSRLEGESRIMQDENGLWILSDQLVEVLVDY